MNPKQAAFAREYIIDCNATQAAIRAGYSAKTARSQGQRLLTNVDIQKAIQLAQNQAAGKCELTFEKSMEILAGIATVGKNDRDRIAAIAQASKMSGWDAANKVEITQPADYDAIREKFERLVERKAKELAGH
jgi:phage terminase small subunit